jgi:hypothetical protein
VKQVCATILALVYLYCTVGATIQQHYCMGELVNISLFGSSDAACGKCGMEKHTANKDCCKDISILVKGADTHNFSQSVYDFHASSFILSVTHFVSSCLNFPQTEIANLYRAHSPPLLRYPLFIQLRNFRI